MTTLLPPLMTDELPLRVEPAELKDADQFIVSQAAQVQHLLTQVCAHQEIVSLYVDESDNFALSSALAISGSLLVLEIPEGLLHDDILAAMDLFCVSTLERVKLQFQVRFPRVIDWQGRSALAVQLPAEILRLQRRDFYRLTVPLGQPLSCHLPVGHGEEMEISLIDISVGGVGILGFVPGLKLYPGAQYHGARIELPDAGTVVADLEIRASFDVTLKNGIKTVRIGTQFINLAGSMQTMIQRYITRIERERIARESIVP